jgi:tRNA(fMet)-specific endonuclease VapC
MNVLDTDMFSLFAAGHPLVVARVEASPTAVVTTVVSRIEILRGRFDFLLKATDSQQLQRAQQWLDQTDHDLANIPILSIGSSSAAQFDRLRENKKLRKIGRADLLIAGIVLAHNATLATRNLRHFRQVPGLRVEDWSK